MHNKIAVASVIIISHAGDHYRVFMGAKKKKTGCVDVDENRQTKLNQLKNSLYVLGNSGRFILKI